MTKPKVKTQEKLAEFGVVWTDKKMGIKDMCFDLSMRAPMATKRWLGQCRERDLKKITPSAMRDMASDLGWEYRWGCEEEAQSFLRKLKRGLGSDIPGRKKPMPAGLIPPPPRLPVGIEIGKKTPALTPEEARWVMYQMGLLPPDVVVEEPKKVQEIETFEEVETTPGWKGGRGRGGRGQGRGSRGGGGGRGRGRGSRGGGGGRGRGRGVARGRGGGGSTPFFSLGTPTMPGEGRKTDVDVIADIMRQQQERQEKQVAEEAARRVQLNEDIRTMAVQLSGFPSKQALDAQIQNEVNKELENEFKTSDVRKVDTANRYDFVLKRTQLRKAAEEKYRLEENIKHIKAHPTIKLLSSSTEEKRLFEQELKTISSYSLITQGYEKIDIFFLIGPGPAGNMKKLAVTTRNALKKLGTDPNFFIAVGISKGPIETSLVSFDGWSGINLIRGEPRYFGINASLDQGKIKLSDSAKGNIKEAIDAAIQDKKQQKTQAKAPPVILEQEQAEKLRKMKEAYEAQAQHYSNLAAQRRVSKNKKAFRIALVPRFLRSDPDLESAIQTAEIISKLLSENYKSWKQPSLKFYTIEPKMGDSGQIFYPDLDLPKKTPDAVFYIVDLLDTIDDPLEDGKITAILQLQLEQLQAASASGSVLVLLLNADADKDLKNKDFKILRTNIVGQPFEGQPLAANSGTNIFLKRQKTPDSFTFKYQETELNMIDQLMNDINQQIEPKKFSPLDIVSARQIWDSFKNPDAGKVVAYPAEKLNGHEQDSLPDAISDIISQATGQPSNIDTALASLKNKQLS